MPMSPTSATLAFERGPAIPDLGVLISGPPIKDASALLRYALPIDNKPIKEIQKSLEEITDEMKIPGEKALGAVERVYPLHSPFLCTLWHLSLPERSQK